MFHDAANDMQLPTHPRLHLRDIRDAHALFEAVRLGLLKPVYRRLNENERATFIQSGAVFVWEESEEETGLKRWTDGRIWSQSRMREPYLFYDEKSSQDEPEPPGQSSRSTFRFVEGPSRTWSSSAQSHYERSEHHPTGLVKQAYSAWVLTAPNARPRKWHLTAYFTYADLPNIPTIDRDPTLRNITVPQGVYKTGKTRTRNPDAGPVPYTLPALHSATHSYPSRPGTPVTLPPLHFGGQGDQAGAARRPQPRRAEDERMIRLLNSKPI